MQKKHITLVNFNLYIKFIDLIKGKEIKTYI